MSRTQTWCLAIRIVRHLRQTNVLRVGRRHIAADGHWIWLGWRRQVLDVRNIILETR